MKVTVVKNTDQGTFIADVNGTILRLQQEGNNVFEFHYQPMLKHSASGNDYVIYTVLIAYK